LFKLQLYLCFISLCLSFYHYIIHEWTQFLLYLHIKETFFKLCILYYCLSLCNIWMQILIVFVRFILLLLWKYIITRKRKEKARIPIESQTRQKCCRLGLTEPVHGRYLKVQFTVLALQRMLKFWKYIIKVLYQIIWHNNWMIIKGIIILTV
jgi:hypothetical protein